MAADVDHREVLTADALVEAVDAEGSGVDRNDLPTMTGASPAEVRRALALAVGQGRLTMSDEGLVEVPEASPTSEDEHEDAADREPDDGGIDEGREDDGEEVSLTADAARDLEIDEDERVEIGAPVPAGGVAREVPSDLARARAVAGLPPTRTPPEEESYAAVVVLHVAFSPDEPGDANARAEAEGIARVAEEAVRRAFPSLPTSASVMRLTAHGRARNVELG